MPDPLPVEPRLPIDRRLSVAPMLDWTDRHCRYFLRLISRRVLLYTEMVTTGALLFGDAARHLDFDPAEHPIALQLGGSEPEALARCTRLGLDWGYDEINLNLGCPSDRVQAGRFGAALMGEPERVAACLEAMIDAAQGDIPITAKCRLGIDDLDSYDFLAAFVARQQEAGCRTFIIHARKAWLTGLSPKENRSVPPLHPARVHRLKQDFPELTIILNGGIETLESAAQPIEAGLDGVMIGRAAYENPFLLSEADRLIFADPTPPRSREEVVRDLVPYVARRQAEGVPVKSITRHLLGLFNGRPGARRWRRHLSENAFHPDAQPSLLLDALAALSSPSPRQPPP